NPWVAARAAPPARSAQQECSWRARESMRHAGNGPSCRWWCGFPRERSPATSGDRAALRRSSVQLYRRAAPGRHSLSAQNATAVSPDPSALDEPAVGRCTIDHSQAEALWQGAEEHEGVHVARVIADKDCGSLQAFKVFAPFHHERLAVL